MKLNDLTGLKFGKLTVIKRMPNNQNNKAVWLCKCECGKEAVIIGAYFIPGKRKAVGA